jgi:hypothetical protein
VRLTLSQGIYGLVSNADGSVTLADNIGYPAEQPYDIQPFPGHAEDNVAGQISSPFFGGYPAIESSPRRLTTGGLSGALVYLAPCPCTRASARSRSRSTVRSVSSEILLPSRSATSARRSSWTTRVARSRRRT